MQFLKILLKFCVIKFHGKLFIYFLENSTKLQIIWHISIIFQANLSKFSVQKLSDILYTIVISRSYYYNNFPKYINIDMHIHQTLYNLQQCFIDVIYL